MGSRIAIAVLLAALTLHAVPSARAADMAPAPGATLVRLTETATANLPRDQLRAQLSVEAKGADAAKVQAEVNRRMAAALALAKKTASVTAETGGYSVYRVTALNERASFRAAALPCRAWSFFCRMNPWPSRNRRSRPRRLRRSARAPRRSRGISA